ncbi:MAG: hypothetical protein IPL26_02190 [Leptospiraceae bacterium]|nr:hypothetical protein [Leptospiraceae bacterium]
MSKKAKGKKSKNEKKLPMSEEEKKRYLEEVDRLAEKAKKEHEEKLSTMTPKELETYNRIMDEEAYRFMDDDLYNTFELFLLSTLFFH